MSNDSITLSLTGDGAIARATVAYSGDRPPEVESKVLELCYEFGEIAVVGDLFNQQVSYCISQTWDNPEPADLEWAKNALNRLEPGWMVEDCKLYSPYPCSTPDRAIAEILRESRRPAPEQPVTLVSEVGPEVLRPNRWKAIATAALGFLAGLAVCALSNLVTV